MSDEQRDEAADRDPMGPPAEPCECECLHCGRRFMSDRMWFQKVIGTRDGFNGFWMCPTPNCSGAGFCFDIFPTDPHHPANAGWTYCGDEETEEETGEEGEDESGAWDADEPAYKDLDDEALEIGDVEGEEWKHGIEPGAGIEAGDTAPREESADERRWRERWEAEQRRFDEPDERPRVVDWSDREEQGWAGEGPDGLMEDDIPF